MPLQPKQEPPYYENSNGITIKQYIALITQNGTAAPTQTILKNTLGFIPTYTYVGVGQYTLQALTGTFISQKQTYAINANDNFLAYMRNTDEETMTIATYNDYDGTTPANGLLDETPINITIYP